MNVVFKLYASLADYLPPEGRNTNSLRLDVAEGTTVGDLIQRYALPEKSCHLVLIDGAFVEPAQRASRALHDGETLAIWPPIAGG